VNDIVQQAQGLGKSIASSSQAALLRKARQALHADEQAMKTLQEFETHSHKMMELEQAGKPVEVDDKHRLEQLQAKLVGMESFKKFSAAQVEYVDLMRQVSDAIRKELSATEED